MEARSAVGALLLLLLAMVGTAESKEITHEDIKDAMLSLVHLMRDNTEKLERHEARDRQTDEQLKKAIGLLTKRVSSVDALKSYLAKVEERVGGIEQLMAQRDERERVHAQKTADTLEDLESRLEGWATEIEAKVGEAAGRAAAKAPELLARLEAVEAALGHKIEAASKAPALDELRGQLGRVLAKLDNATGPCPSAAVGDETDGLRAMLRSSLERLKELPRVAELQAMHNESRAALERTAQELREAGERAAETLRAGQAAGREQAHSELEALKGEVSGGAARLGKELHELGKGQAVMMEMADHVLDTKKRLEHAYKILREVGELVMAQGLNINSTLNARFDVISADIMDNQNGALANLTLKMEQEMNQVWRQINVMYQQMMESAKALDKLHKQNEAYVNGTTETMDGMEGKVGEITKRMTEVDTNLNYLLGRLSLVTQEFNQIKEGLGAALDNIKASFHEVQQRANDLSPGPHPLPRDYSEPEASARSDLPSVNLPSSRR